MNINTLVKRATRFLTRDVWLLNINDPDLSYWQLRGAWWSRMLFLTVKRFKHARCGIRSSSLTTVTIISIVPVLAFAFSIAKGFGAYQNLQSNFITPTLDQWLGSEQAPELRSAVDQIFVFVEKTDLSSLGLIGFLTVAYAVIRLLSSVEDSFNDLWGIKASRTIARKLADYLSVTVIVPIVLIFAATVSSAFRSGSLAFWLDTALNWGAVGVFLLMLLLFPLVWLGFATVYRFMPNTKVDFNSAILGGVVGGSMWMFFHYLHLQLQVGVANYNAIYSGFSAFPIFMLWVFFSWVAVLIGAAFAAASETKEKYREKVIRDNLHYRDRELLCLRVGIQLSERFQKDQGAIPMDTLCEDLHENEATLQVVVSDLKRAGIVEVTQDGGLILGRTPVRLFVTDFVDALKGNQRPLVDDDDSSAEHKKEILLRLREKHQIRENSETENHSLKLSLAGLCRKGFIEELEPGIFSATDSLHAHWLLEELFDEMSRTNANHRMDKLCEQLHKKKMRQQIREA